MGDSYLAPTCRVCGQTLKLLDDTYEQWYCDKDCEVWFAKQQKWSGEMPFGFAIRKTTQSFIEWQKEEQRQQEERNKKHGTNAISDIERQVFGVTRLRGLGEH